MSAREMAEALLAFLGSPARPAPVARLLAALARPGVLVGLSLDGARRVWTLGPAPLAAQSFEIASLTKPFTAALLMVLAREGRIHPERPLAGQFAAFRGLPARVTPLALATHTAGLPGHPLRSYLSALTRYYDPYGALTAEQLIRSARRWAGLTPPGFRYSNLGYGLLGLALEEASGLDLPAALRHHLTVPLGLQDTSFELPSPARLATPHLLGRPVPVTEFGRLGGAGGLFSTAGDLLTWLEAQQRTPGELGAALRDTQAERRRLPPTPFLQGVAAGWLCARVNGRAWRWHGGTARGTRGVVAFAPGGREALVVLTDSGPAGAAAPPERLLFALLALLSRRR